MTGKKEKAKLKVQLYANDLLIEESDDPGLWRKVLGAIHSGAVFEDRADGAEFDEGKKLNTGSSSGSALAKFAAEIGVTEDELEGACAPSIDKPYIHLDEHCWESLKSNTPARGPKAVAPTTLAAALLGMWFKHAGIDSKPTQALCKEVLMTINVRETNAPRAIRNCEWLQSRDGIVINPAHRSKAIKLVKAYCKKTPIED